VLDDANEDGDDEMALTGDAATGGGWYEEEVSDDSSMDHHHHHHGHDDIDGSDDSDESGESVSDGDTGSQAHQGPGDPEYVSGVASLHTLTVARSAATRADGRRYHHLEHFDRLIVMELVPELSILIAASQKGTVTIFRLLRVLDDTATTTTSPGAQVPSEPSSPAAAASSQDAILHHRDKRHKGKGNEGKNKDRSRSKNKNEPKTITIKGVNFVLFPEMYLPRLEPPPLPLYGVSVVPLQPSKPTPSRKGNSPARTPTPALAPVSTPTSFILHMMYMDSQLFSYELRLRNDRDDPVRLNNIFV
jgi:hypothetical protein